MGKLADAYKKEHGDVKITVTTSDSGTGVKDAQSGLNDFGMASRNLKTSETGVVSKQIATDGIALIVNKESAVANVTSEEVYELYANGLPFSPPSPRASPANLARAREMLSGNSLKIPRGIL